MTNEIDITGLRPSRVLQALHNGTRALGLGVLQDRGDITEAEALAEMAKRTMIGVPADAWHFDYVRGRPLKISIVDLASGPDRHSSKMVLRRADLYDRDAPGGPGSCARIIAALRADLSAGVDVLPSLGATP